MEQSMKIGSTKLAIVLLLIVSSVCSYIYLNTYQYVEAAVSEEQTILEEEKPQEEVFLPDVRMIKKVVDGAQRLIPSS